MESVAIPEHLIKLLPVAEPGIFDLVGYIISTVEGNQYQSVFYNGNIVVVKQGKMWRGMDVLIFNVALVDPYRPHPTIRFLWLLLGYFLSFDSFDDVYVCSCGPGGTTWKIGTDCTKT
ncbi:hypothetical protein F2Q69_00011094 [Brassica cretica]|uniref:Uncharacterized protein n=1 Tax=Brassica cretica TaxID=69181 RepID=A0A8S9R5B9_BRACR|nr:hypothetical protein F2Q69_00011094 [Brassica cretica]